MASNADDKRLILIGASVRTLAFAVIRAGWFPCCADLFADRDLQACSAVTKIAASRYPRGLLQWLRKSAPPGPVLYTGKLERYFHVLAQVRKERQLWGNPATVARAVRNPAKLAQAVNRSGLPFADWHRSPESLPQNGTWLAKCEAGVVRWYGQHLCNRVRYYQRYVPGTPASAVYLADGHSCIWVGATQQLVGCAWLQAREFQWCGNVGPLPCAPCLAERLRQLGETLTRSFGLRGVFGVDFVLQDQIPWLVEINPRYPASLEVLELASGWSWFSAHAAVFTGVEHETPFEHFCPNLAPLVASPRHYVGKAILYAPQPIKFRLQDIADVGPILTPNGLVSDVALADVPQESALLPRRFPILTVLVRGKGWSETLDRLQQVAAQLYTVWQRSPKP